MLGYQRVSGTTPLWKRNNRRTDGFGSGAVDFREELPMLCQEDV